MINLPQVTIVGIDCVDPSRLKLVMDLSQKHIEFGAAKMLSSIKIDDPRWIGIKPIRTHEDHSGFCLRDLVNYIATDFALIIQWDGFVLNPGSWSNVFFGLRLHRFPVVGKRLVY